MEKIKLRKNLFVFEKDKILQVIKKINSNALKICFVLSKTNKVLGTISDGDIRRSVIKNKNLNKKLLAINLCNKKFNYLNHGSFEDAVIKKILRKKIQYLPVLKNGKLEELYDTKNLNKNFTNQPVLILAGGKGIRLRPMTLKTPKPLIKLGNKPIIQHILDKLELDGFRNIFISVNYLKNKFKIFQKKFQSKSELNITFLEENQPLGTAGCLFYLKNYDFEYLIIINGDIYYEHNLAELLRYHKKNKNDITISVRNYKNKIKYGAIELKKGKFADIKEKPTTDYVISVGIYVINKKIISKLKKPFYLDMTKLIKKENYKKSKVGIYEFKGLYHDIADITDLNNVKSLVQNA